MPKSAPIAARHSFSAAEPALEGVDARDIQSSDTDQPSFGQATNPAVPTPIEIAFGSFRLIPTQFLLLELDKPVRVGSRALNILIALLERPGELVSKRDLMGRVWPDTFVGPANLTVHICALRRALRDGREGNRFIINVPGRGYSFVASVETEWHARSKRSKPVGGRRSIH